MSTHCPACGHASVAAQDIETLSDSALLVKLEKRIQLCCQECGWMAFADISLDRPPPPASPGMHYRDTHTTLSQSKQSSIQAYTPIAKPNPHPSE